MKYAIIIPDGCADNPVPELGGITPLEAACIPALDALAAEGALGCVRTVPFGVPAGSDTAILSIFGCDPRVYHTGRSPLEAAGAGVELAPGDVSYRCNLAALSDEPGFLDKKLLSHSAGGIDGETAHKLAVDLIADPEFAAALEKRAAALHPSYSYRHIAVFKGGSPAKCRPPHDNLGAPIGGVLPDSAAIRELTELSHKILDNHPINVSRRAEGKLPANCLWFWAEGVAGALPSLAEKYGIRGIAVSAVPLVRGIGRLCGFDAPECSAFTGELDTDYEGKADMALAAFDMGYDCAVIHVEAPDECTHNGDLQGKIQAIENIDSRVVKRLLDGLNAKGEPYRVLALSDHKTLTATRGHDGDPVPFVLYDSSAGKPPCPLRFGEKYAEGDEFVENGHDLIGRLFA